MCVLEGMLEQSNPEQLWGMSSRMQDARTRNAESCLSQTSQNAHSNRVAERVLECLVEYGLI